MVIYRVKDDSLYLSMMAIDWTEFQLDSRRFEPIPVHNDWIRSDSSQFKSDSGGSDQLDLMNDSHGLVDNDK